jgi:outer membrane biosynthesis protein TonB
MDRAGATGFGVALVGHGALLLIVLLALRNATQAPPASPPAMEVSFVDEIAATSSSPAPSPEPAAEARAPELGPVEDEAPAPAPTAPAQREAVPAPSPTPAPAPPSRAQSRPAPPATAGTGQATRRPGLGDLDPRAFGRDPAAHAESPPAAVMSAAAAANIAQAITRQVQPCADRQVYPGPGAERIRTGLALRLNRDGSLAARPRVVGQSGVDDENRRYADRVADLAIATFTGCAPLRGLPQELYDVPRGWSNFTMYYRLPG